MTNERWLTVQAVRRWLAFREENGDGPPSEPDWDHSALLARLVSGKSPLPEPPPKSFSYPWYELIDNGSAVATEVREVRNWHDNDEVLLSINQARWKIIEKSGDSYRVQWPPTGLPCDVQPEGEFWRVTVVKDQK
jgi:hypothetical protein